MNDNKPNEILLTPIPFGDKHVLVDKKAWPEHEELALFVDGEQKFFWEYLESVRYSMCVYKIICHTGIPELNGHGFPQVDLAGCDEQALSEGIAEALKFIS